MAKQRFWGTFWVTNFPQSATYWIYTKSSPEEHSHGPRKVKRMKVQNIFQKYELPLFFLLALALSWWTVPFMKGGLFPYGPSIAAAIVIAVTAGKEGLRGYWRRITNWRAGWWYLAGPAIIAGYLFAAYVLSLLLGASVTNSPHLPPASVLLTLLLIGGMWEEPGWSGYAYPRMREKQGNRKYAALEASLLLGLLWGIWHLPLYLYGTLPWYDIFLFVPAIRVIFSWLYNKSDGSVPVIMLTHYTSNVLTGSTMLLVFTDVDRTTFYTLIVLCTCITALLIAWRSSFMLGESETALLRPTRREV